MATERQQRLEEALRALPDARARAIRHVLAVGYARVVVLGSEHEMADGALRHILAACGRAVLVPPQPVRAWIAGCLRTGFSDADCSQLKGLLEDAREHGASAVVATEPALVAALRQADLAMEVVDAHVDAGASAEDECVDCV